MKISIERTGGVAGIKMATMIDATELLPDDSQKLRQMVGNADFFRLPARITSRSPQPDRFQYELSLEEEGQQHTVTVSEESMPAKLKPLVNWLMETARKKRKGAGSP